MEGRLKSLDVFRGLTIALMIVVNTPGNETAYPPLEHAVWHGCTPADLVFPFFLFIVGAAMTFSLSKRREAGARPGDLALQAVQRAGVIFLIGLALEAVPEWRPADLRVLGVLQRIALCYMAAACLYAAAGPRAAAPIAAGILVGYWLLITRARVPGFGHPDLSVGGNIASWLDRALLGRHAYRHGPYDPEGTLSTLPAVATTLVGIVAGDWLRSPREPKTKASGLALGGGAAAVLGWLWSLSFPFNKTLWTSSYALYTAGLASIALAVCYWVIDVRGRQTWCLPFEVFGLNPLAAYVLPILPLKVALMSHAANSRGALVDVKDSVCDAVFGTWLAPRNASLAFALSYTAVWLGVLWIFYRKRLFLRA